MSVENVGTVESLSGGFSAALVAGNVKKAMSEAGAKSRDLWQVAVGNLRVLEGFNVRVQNDALTAHIEGLADSMVREGFYQDKPLGGYIAKIGDENVVYITDGHCRLEAIKLARSRGAEIEVVPVVVTAGGTNLEDLTVGLVRSNTGKALTPFELAVVAKRLVKFGWAEKEVAERMGVSVTTVKNYLALMEAPLEIREMVASSTVGLHTALETLRAQGSNAVAQLQAAAATKAGEKSGGSGKKVERRDVAPLSFGSSMKKAAPRLFETITDVRADAGYAALTEGTRKKIDGLVAELEALRAKGSKSEAGEVVVEKNEGATEDKASAAEAVPA